MKLFCLDGPDVPQINASIYSGTEGSYSALEKGNISFICQATSKPLSQYVWLYNKSEIYSGPQLNITNIQRVHAGLYTCLAQNTYINNHAQKTITLTVYCECYYKVLLCAHWIHLSLSFIFGVCIYKHSVYIALHALYIAYLLQDFTFVK